jgi:hypothetical protein
MEFIEVRMIRVRCGALLAAVALSSRAPRSDRSARLAASCSRRGLPRRDQPAEIRLVGPSAERPIGGAVVRIWTRVSNPNAFGFRLATLRTTLLLDGSRAATGDFPLGLPLGPREETVVPLDLFNQLQRPGGACLASSAAPPTARPYPINSTARSGSTPARSGSRRSARRCCFVESSTPYGVREREKPLERRARKGRKEDLPGILCVLGALCVQPASPFHCRSC